MINAIQSIGARGGWFADGTGRSASLRAAEGKHVTYTCTRSPPATRTACADGDDGSETISNDVRFARVHVYTARNGYRCGQGDREKKKSPDRAEKYPLKSENELYDPYRNVNFGKQWRSRKFRTREGEAKSYKKQLYFMICGHNSVQNSKIVGFSSCYSTVGTKCIFV